MNLIAVAIGGALGSLFRYLLSLTLNQPNWPYGTWIANVLGSCLIGVFFVWGKEKGLLAPALYLFFVTGMMGGFTTFSTFSLEVIQYLQSGQWERALAYALSSVGVGLAAVYVGILAARQIFG